MKIKTAICEYLIEIEVRKYTPRTIKGYRTNLNLFLRFCEEKSRIEDAEDITLGVVKQLMQFLTGQGKAETTSALMSSGSIWSDLKQSHAQFQLHHKNEGLLKW